MNENLKSIYKIVDGTINEKIVEHILGETIGVGITMYYKYSGVSDIDYTEILLTALDSQLFDNKDFVEHLVMRVNIDRFIKEIAKNLKINNLQSDFKIKKEILKKSTKKKKEVLINILQLDVNYFLKEVDRENITSEEITPFSPVPVNKKDPLKLEYAIPREFLSLHDYQKRVKNTIINKLLFEESDSRTLVHMPTGSGKTKTSMEAIVDFIRTNLTDNKPSNIIWFAHTKELCEQAYDSFKSIWQYRGDFPVNTYKIFGNTSYDEVSNCVEKQVSVIFIGFQKFHSLLKSNDYHELKEHLHTRTRLVIVDEAHKSLATTYEQAIDFVSQMPNCRLLGLTATPGRSNYVVGSNENNSLSQYFDQNQISITNDKLEKINDPLTYLQKQNVLATIEEEPLDFAFDLKKFGYTKKQLNDVSKNRDGIGKKELDHLATDPHRNHLIVNKIRDHYGKQKSILVFACSVAHCIILKHILNTVNVESDVVLGSTNDSKREDVIKRFKSNELKVIINFGVLTTGFDAPNLNTLIVARPTKSVVLYSQIVGRALRGERMGGNKKNTLITIKDNMEGFPNPEFMFSYWKDFWN